MMSEFTERTGCKPSSEEYHFIEESHYDFPGDKDAFCKQGLRFAHMLWIHNMRE